MTDLGEIRDAYEWVSAGPWGENRAYVNRETGHVYWDTDAYEPEEGLPEDLEDDTKYVAVPHKYDLDLGKELIFAFINERSPDLYDHVRGIFSRRGAYSRYKNLLEEEGLLQDWYTFEDESINRALGDWLRGAGIEFEQARPSSEGSQSI